MQFKIFMLFLGLAFAGVWAVYLFKMFAALKNKRYRAFAISFGVFVISVAALIPIAMILYNEGIRFCEEGITATKETTKEILLVLFGFVTVIGHFFLVWYMFLRPSFDFIHVKGSTADELEKLTSPRTKSLLGLK